MNFLFCIDGMRQISTLTSITRGVCMIFANRNRRVPKRQGNSEQWKDSLKKRKMPLQAFESPEYVIRHIVLFPYDNRYDNKIYGAERIYLGEPRSASRKLGWLWPVSRSKALVPIRSGRLERFAFFILRNI